MTTHIYDRDGPSVIFVSLGMFIIDTIITASGETLDNIIGGAGTFAAIGARICTLPLETGFIVDYGKDTPDQVEQTIDSFTFTTDVRRDQDRHCTRGLNTYVNGMRMFEYLTPKIRITADQLSPKFLASSSFHLICGPQRCLELVDQLRSLRAAQGLSKDFVTVWEPVPDACISRDRALFAQSIRVVTVLSPNSSEAAGILGYEGDFQERTAIERMASGLLDSGARTVIIRCAEQGAYLANEATHGWYPAYYQDPTSVVDPTGGGNAFCGAITAALARKKTFEDAMCYAAVAAALAISQIGLPEVITRDGCELWNGRQISDMLTQYRKRIS